MIILPQSLQWALAGAKGTSEKGAAEGQDRD